MSKNSGRTPGVKAYKAPAATANLKGNERVTAITYDNAMQDSALSVCIRMMIVFVYHTMVIRFCEMKLCEISYICIRYYLTCAGRIARRPGLRPTIAWALCIEY